MSEHKGVNFAAYVIGGVILAVVVMVALCCFGLPFIGAVTDGAP